ncbi:MAG: hypothetical protein ABIP03_08240 [Aquihabitans sp.]
MIVHRRRQRVALLAVPLLFFVGACSSSDDSSNQTTTSTSAADGNGEASTTTAASDGPEAAEISCDADKEKGADNLSGSASVLFSADVDDGTTDEDIPKELTLSYDAKVLSPSELTVEVGQRFGVRQLPDTGIGSVKIGCAGGQTSVPNVTIGFVITEPGTYPIVDDMSGTVLGSVTVE